MALACLKILVVLVWAGFFAIVFELFYLISFERTQEFRLYRQIGFSKGRLTMLLFIEAVQVSFLSAVIGSGLGTAAVLLAGENLSVALGIQYVPTDFVSLSEIAAIIGTSSLSGLIACGSFAVKFNFIYFTKTERAPQQSLPYV